MNDEETKRQTEKEAEKGSEQKGKDDNDKGNQSELSKQTKLANAAAERLEKAKEELDAAQAKARLGGFSEGGQDQKEEKEETPHEYRVRIEKDLATGITEFGN